MGLGKTLQSLTVFDAKTLVICPTSLVFNWKNELAQFRPDLSVSIFMVPKESWIKKQILSSQHMASLEPM